MKQLLILLLFISGVYNCNAQYTREKLISILTDNEKVWTVKKGTAPGAKTFTFNKNFTAEVVKQNGKNATVEWTLSTLDNIRWFITIDNQKFELIVSYDKTGQQYLKLNLQPRDIKTSVYEETILYPTK